MMARSSTTSATTTRKTDEGKEVSELELEQIVTGVGTELAVNSGVAVFEKGDPGQTMFYVLEGAIEIRSAGKLIETCGPGEFLGYMSIIDDLDRTSDAIASENSKVAVLDSKKFWFMMDEVPNFNKLILNAMAKRIRGMAAAAGD